MPYKFEITKDKEGKFRFRFVAPNGQIMFQGQGYTEKSSALKTIESLKKNVADADIEDQSQ